MIHSVPSTREGIRAEVRNEAVRNWVSGLLPTPHLLDAAWWFDDNTVALFHHMIESVPSGVVACLGAPNVFVRAASSEVQGKVILIDGDPAVARSLYQAGYTNVVTADLMREVPQRMNAKLIIADPPWYEAEMKAFLAVAQAIAETGAEILMSIPPINIRPGIEAERSRIFNWATHGGLDLLSITPCGTRYISPPFEQNALRSSGVVVADDWRVGDLVRFRVCHPEGLHITSFSKECEWQDICLLNTRFRIANKPAKKPGDPRLIAMGWPEDIFPSCSRRYPGRDEVDVWTSGNRAFRCDDCDGLAGLAQSLRSNNFAAFREKVEQFCASPMQHLRETALQLCRIVETEENEYEAIRVRYA